MDEDQSLGRAQRRLLRRIYNGRTVPIVIEGAAFLTYKEAARHILVLPPEQRDAVCAAMKEQAK